MRRFFCWLLLSVLGFALVTACQYHPSPTILSRSQLPTADCRMVKHKLGETCIPTNPQRVVTLHTSILAHVLALGIKPIGSTYIQTLKNNFEIPPYLKPYLSDIQVLGGYNPNLESILHAKPDLIIGYDWETKVYPLLAQIAPTLLSEVHNNNDWRKSFQFVAEVLGRQEVAQQAWDRYYQRIAKLKTALGTRYQNQKISLLSISGGEIFSEVNGSFPDRILKDVGLSRPAAQNVNIVNNYMPIVEEELDKADGDILFVGMMTTGDRQKLADLKQKPLWQKLRAVQQDRVYPVDYMTWRGFNLLAADAIIDDLFKYLVNVH
ncbi:MAG: iron-siderophore ABC transporter substrate-binding protein [Goleter apudmare HA4340-LM2]|nr:iron-siderophore ABC transporter substrate-binding protein [Goleter apudmare HA4340-LM2]